MRLMRAWATGDQIGLEHLPEELAASHGVPGFGAGCGAGSGRGGSLLAQERQRIRLLIDRQEREKILSLLVKNRGNVSQVSRDLGISRNSLYRKLRRLNISR